MIKLNEEQIKTLKKYNIDYYSFSDIEKLIDVIFDKSLDYLDEKDEPKDECVELEKIGDYLIYEQEKVDEKGNK